MEKDTTKHPKLQEAQGYARLHGTASAAAKRAEEVVSEIGAARIGALAAWWMEVYGRKILWRLLERRLVPENPETAVPAFAHAREELIAHGQQASKADRFFNMDALYPGEGATIQIGEMAIAFYGSEPAACQAAALRFARENGLNLIEA